MTDFPTLLYTSTCDIPTLFYIPKAWKMFPFRAKPPRVGHYRKYPPPPGINGGRGGLSRLVRRPPSRPRSYQRRPFISDMTHYKVIEPFRFSSSKNRVACWGAEGGIGEKHDEKLTKMRASVCQKWYTNCGYKHDKTTHVEKKLWLMT